MKWLDEEITEIFIKAEIIDISQHSRVPKKVFRKNSFSIKGIT